MISFKHVLVPTDFGDAAGRALDAAVGVAEKFGAKLTLLHTYELPALMYGVGLAWPLDDLRQAAQEALDDALARTKARYPRAEAVLVYGDPRSQILEVAEARGADLIVMGTHGRKGLAHALLGSVAERVVRSSPVPVLTTSSRGESG